jgi:hypothetical protein
MQTFTTRANGFPAIRKKVLMRMLPVFAITFSVAVGISLFQQSDNKETMQSVLMGYMVGGLLIFGGRVFMEIKKRRKIYDTYSLTIDDLQIVREQHNTPAITTYLDNVTDIIKLKDGSFIIKGKQSTTQITVPAQMDNYDQLEQALNQIKPVTTDTSSLLGAKLRAFLFLPIFGSLLIINNVENKVVVAIAAFVAVGLVLWNFITVQRNKNIDRVSKNMSWISMLVLVAVVAAAWLRLTAE